MCKKRNSLEECQTQAEFDYYITHHGGERGHQVGSHQKYVGPRGSTVIQANHPNEQLQKGTRHALVRECIAIGITVLIIGMLVVRYII